MIVRDLSYLIILFYMLTTEVRQSTLVCGIQQQQRCDVVRTYFILLHWWNNHPGYNTEFGTFSFFCLVFEYNDLHPELTFKEIPKAVKINYSVLSVIGKGGFGSVYHVLEKVSNAFG